jgi:hypothetical protein
MRDFTLAVYVRLRTWFAAFGLVAAVVWGYEALSRGGVPGWASLSILATIIVGVCKLAVMEERELDRALQ